MGTLTHAVAQFFPCNAPFAGMIAKLVDRRIAAAATIGTAVGLVVGMAMICVPTAAHAQSNAVRNAAPTAVDTLAAADTSALAALHAAIVRSNPELIARRAALDAARARLNAAGFAAPSVLSAEIEDVPSGVNVAHAGSARITVDHEFLSGGRRSAARSLASADVAVVSADLYAAERRVTAVGTQALTRAAGWAAIARRLEDEDSTLSAAQTSLRVRFATGGARYVDVLRLRTERLRVETEQAAAVTEARVARQALEALVGRSNAVSTATTAFLDSLVGVRVRSVVATPTAMRGPAQAVQAALLPPAPDVDSLLIAAGVTRSANAAVGQARAANRFIIANQRPRLTGFVGAQRFLGDNGNFTLGPVVGGSISLPFTARRAYATAQAAARSDVNAALAERTATLSSVRADLFAARARYEAARARLAVYNAALLTGAREERESALAAYRAGTLTLIELLDFERALARAEIDRLTSQIDAATALTDLLTGGVTSPIRPQVNPAVSTTMSTVSTSPNVP